MNRNATWKAVDGIRDSAEGIWESGLEKFRESGLNNLTFQSPIRRRNWTDNLGSKAVLISVLSITGALAAIGAYLYLRKRKQVADHYTIGELDGGYETPRSREFESPETARVR